jgi:hypothetical protein
MRPQSVSFADVQRSDAHWWQRIFNPLRRWKQIVEAQQDLYLPCGVKCLESLRQSMIVEEVTLTALAYAVHNATENSVDTGDLCRAQQARASRLKDLRKAATCVAVIGEYYRLKRRSTIATYVGVLCGVAGTALLISVFTWLR